MNLLRVVGVGVYLTWASGALALTQPAAAADPQPLVVPGSPSNEEVADATAFNPTVPKAGNFVSLQSLFQFRRENLDPLGDAKVEPATFSPLCGFTVTLVLRGGACKLAFGWYNAVQSGGLPPPANQIYPIIPDNEPAVYAQTAFAPLATEGPWAVKPFKVSDIQQDARYTGGEIGFALIGGAGVCSQTKYSQRALNQVCTSCTPQEPFITSVVYTSVRDPNAYYLAFEDLPVSPTSFTLNNDGDFNDFVFFLEGLTCAGGGKLCDTGLSGVCSVGSSDCSEAGKPGACHQVQQPGGEKCDNLDNDCNGVVDDGDLCPNGQVCDHGSCLASCGTGEFRCPAGLSCEKGLCVNARCQNVQCPTGSECRAGKCLSACDGIQCPADQECQLGRCIDKCAEVACADGQVCDGGLCVPSCDCLACGAGRACGAAGKCVDVGCENKACGIGQVCVVGECKDPCDGAVCPDGGACFGGTCLPPGVAAPTGTSGAGGSGVGGNGNAGSAGAGGRAGSGSGGTSNVAGQGASVAGSEPVAGSPPGNGNAGESATTETGGQASGGSGTSRASCLCSAPGAPAPGDAAVLFGLAALAALRARRRERAC